MRCKLGAFIFIAFLLPTALLGQSPVRPDLAQMVITAEISTKAYVEAFRNLVDDETKVFELYNKEGVIRKTTTIQSNFLVYPLSGEGNKVAEFRNVFAVNGKILENTDKRVAELFEKVAKTKSSDSERKRLRDESLRFDEDLKIYGITLFQGIELDSALKEYFDFKFEGPRQADGRTINVISFHQNKACPYIGVNNLPSPAPGRRTQSYHVSVDGKGNLNARIHGEVWIDAATNQLWREIRQVMVQPEGFALPETAINADFRFQTSEFGMFPPKVIRYTQNHVNMKDHRIVSDLRVTFTYTNFTRSDVVVKSEIK